MAQLSEGRGVGRNALTWDSDWNRVAATCDGGKWHQVLGSGGSVRGHRSKGLGIEGQVEGSRGDAHVNNDDGRLTDSRVDIRGEQNIRRGRNIGVNAAPPGTDEATKLG